MLRREKLAYEIAVSAMNLQNQPYSVILVVGVNGVGKTTTIAKLASIFQAYGKKILLVAGDTFRAGAIEQLIVWGTRLGIDVHRGSAGADPSSVIFDALSAARRELEEETGLKAMRLTEFGSFSNPDRDPRGRVVTISFYTVLTGSVAHLKAGDDAGQAAWFSVRRLPELAFDHREMIAQGLRQFRRTSRHSRS